MIAQIFTERVGMSLTDYARKVLFEPLGITDWEWINDIRGRPLAFAGLRLRSRDLARIGRMVIGWGKIRGKWHDKQVVPSARLNESLRGQIDMENPPGWQYDYQWWTGKIEAVGKKRDWGEGFGNGGQRLFLMLELDLVIVITAGEYNQSAIGSEAYQLFKRVVGAVRE